MEYTYDDPGCYHSALKYASECTGMPIDKEMVVDNLDDLYYKAGKRKKLLYKSYNIQVVDEAGNKVAFHDGTRRFDEQYPEFRAVKFIAITQRPLGEFGIPVIKSGKYKDSLGGGWHQMVERFTLNDKHFAMMDCAHSYY